MNHYLEMPIARLFKKRIVWLVVLFLGEMLTATVMKYFEDEIAKAVVLALFIPLIISSGGNSGSQASTLIIQAMAMGELTVSEWWRVLKTRNPLRPDARNRTGTDRLLPRGILNSMFHTYGDNGTEIGLTSWLLPSRRGALGHHYRVHASPAC